MAREAAKNPRVVATAPYVTGQGMLTRGRAARGALVRGVLPGEEGRVTDLGQHMTAGRLEALRPGEFGVVRGADLARALGALPATRSP